MKPADSAAYVGSVISLFGYLSLNFMNFGSVPVFGAFDQTFGWIYLHSFNLLLPYESWDYGLIAGVYFATFLVCFMTLNRHQGLLHNVWNTIALTSAIVLLTELGIYLSQPWFLNVYVITAQAGTSLAWFSNLDLMVVASVVLLMTSVPKSLVRGRNTPASLRR